MPPCKSCIKYKADAIKSSLFLIILTIDKTPTKAFFFCCPVDFPGGIYVSKYCKPNINAVSKYSFL